MAYRKREDFKGGEETDVELLLAAGDLLAGVYKLKDVPDCAIVAGYVRELKSEEEIKNSPVNQTTSMLSGYLPPPNEVLPKGETGSDETKEKPKK